MSSDRPRTDMIRAAQPPALIPQNEVTALLQAAVDKNLDVEKLRELVALRCQIEDRAARREFFEAMARFRAACPRIIKRHENAQFEGTVSRDGIRRARRYADLEDIAATIDPILPDYGLSYRWGDVEIEEGRIQLACIVTHASGHSETSIVVMPSESKAGASPQQKFYAATTYARRLSLNVAFGFAAFDDDNDGNAESNEPITEQQLGDLENMIESVGADRERFLRFLAVESLSALPAARYAEAIDALKAKGAQQR